MESSLTITAVGDTFPANLTYHKTIGIAGQFAKHKGKPWKESISSFFSDTDIGIANLESPLLDESIKPEKMSFAGHNEFAGFLRSCGVNLVSIANNHILEKGDNGFNNTINVLKRNNIDIVGIYETHGSNIVKIKKNDISISFAAFNAIKDFANPQKHANYSVENVLSTIRRMGKSDYKILIFHWGNEYINIPSFDQIAEAKIFIDAGADVIIGHHPHVIQPVMEYNGGLVFFSLGNFLFDMTYRNNVRIGMIAKIRLTKGERPKYKINGTYISDEYTPVPYDEQLFYKLMNKYNQSMKLMMKLPTGRYQNIYNRTVERNRFLQRLCMKGDLLPSFKKLPAKEKSNLMKYLLQRIRKVAAF